MRGWLRHSVGMDEGANPSADKCATVKRSALPESVSNQDVRMGKSVESGESVVL